MRSHLVHVVVFTILTLAPVGFTLDAGVASCDITPDVQAYTVPMSGYGDRKGRPSTGVHDPLRAKALLLRDGETTAALVTTDLRSVTPELKEQILAKTQDLGLRKENLMLAASHTHCGPSMYPEKFWQVQFGVYDPAIVVAMSDAIASALHEAAGTLAPARVGLATAELPEFKRNRRWGYATPAREAAGETPCLQPNLTVIRVDNEDGAARAVLVHFAVHPTILGADNFLLSAEWPGVVQRAIESAVPGAAAMYVNGAEGDQSPNGAQGADAFAKVEDFGQRIAKRALEVAENIETKPGMPLEFGYVEHPLGEPVFSEASKTGPYAALLESALEALPRHAILQQLRIGDIVLAGLPGEPICEVGRDVESRLNALGVIHPLVVGLANDYIGYIVNPKEYAHGGYEVDQRSYYGPSLGDVLADATAKSVQTMSVSGATKSP